MALGGYNEPDGHEHKDRIEGPLPVGNLEHIYCRQWSLEDSLGGYENEKYRKDEDLERHQTSEGPSRQCKDDEKNANLAEVAAPPPVDRGEEKPRVLNWRSAPPIHLNNEPKSTKPASKSRPASKLLTEIYIISYLIFFSIIGTLARLGLQALTFYPGAPVQTGVLWANFAGSLIMGFLSEDQRLFREEWGSLSNPKLANSLPPLNPPNEGKPPPEVDHTTQKKKHATVKKTIPLYIGLATGFCGSFTSFSSFIRDVFLALSNDLPSPSATPTGTIPRSGGYSFLALLAIIILTLSLCLSALQFGAHIALALDPYTPILSFSLTRRFLDRFIIFLALAAWIAAIVLSIFPPTDHTPWRTQALFALVFAPPGCLLRFYISRALNARIPSFPLGTFIVNILGTALEGMFYDLQHSPLTVGGGALGCQVLQGTMDGFCGCLTTVSTWVGELKGLRRRHAYIYGTSSILVAFAFLVVEMGPVRWGRGFAAPACG